MVVQMHPNALEVMGKRYYAHSLNESNPQEVWSRVSGGNKEFYDMMADLIGLPNSPTIFNLGVPNGGTLSACFVFDIADSLNGDWPPGGNRDTDPNSIMGTAFKASCVAKAGGGVGYYFGNIRPEGSEVQSVHRKACGPVAVLRYLHALRSLITQGGKRDLAQMGVLPCWHKDVRQFIHAKDSDPKALESFNISVSWTDEWLKKVDFGNENSVTFPTTGAGNLETQIWVEQAISAWRTGDPGMLFFDTINKWNATPHLGSINATNPCGETPNLNNEPCNLGSLNVARFVDRDKKAFRWDEVAHYARLMTRFLDWILDQNVFPHPDITKASLATRKLGLGVMGWADALALMNIPYDTNDAVDLGEELMREINYEAKMESIDLGHTKGLYTAYDPERNPDWVPKCRNSTRTSIAPTGTIALLANCSSSIEPHPYLEWERTTNEGLKLKERVQVLDEIGDFVPKTAQEIHWRWHVRHQAAFQKHTDLGVSKTINMPNTATVKDVSDAYRLMYESGCKGGTIFRDGCRSEQVLVGKPTKSVYMVETNGISIGKVVSIPSGPSERKMPQERDARTVEAKIGGVDVYLTPGKFEDGTLGEIWLTVGMAGTTLSNMVDAWAMQVSKSLQYGMPLERIVKMYTGRRGEPCGLTGDRDVPVCTSIPDFVVRKLAAMFLKRSDTDPNKHTEASTGSGQYCPDCGSELRFQAGCMTCDTPGCGFSKCG